MRHFPCTVPSRVCHEKRNSCAYLSLKKLTCASTWCLPCREGRQKVFKQRVLQPRATNEDVFEHIVRPLAEAHLNGAAGEGAAVISYGATGTGKTHHLGRCRRPRHGATGGPAAAGAQSAHLASHDHTRLCSTSLGIHYSTCHLQGLAAMRTRFAWKLAASAHIMTLRHAKQLQA